MTCGGRLVAAHERCWDVHQTLTDPEHAAAAKAMRRTLRAVIPSPGETEVEVRQLASYDTLLGISDINDGVGGVA